MKKCLEIVKGSKEMLFVGICDDSLVASDELAQMILEYCKKKNVEVKFIFFSSEEQTPIINIAAQIKNAKYSYWGTRIFILCLTIFPSAKKGKYIYRNIILKKSENSPKVLL